MAVFGFDSIGGSTANPAANTCHGSKFTLSENGTITKVTAYISSNTGGNVNVRAGIYSDSSGWWANLQDSSSAVVVGTSASWVDFTLDTPLDLTAGTYWLALLFESSTNFYYDAGSSNQGSSVTDTYSNGFASPQGQQTRNTNKFSIYATYTVPTEPDIDRAFDSTDSSKFGWVTGVKIYP